MGSGAQNVIIFSLLILVTAIRFIHYPVFKRNNEKRRSHISLVSGTDCDIVVGPPLLAKEQEHEKQRLLHFALLDFHHLHRYPVKQTRTINLFINICIMIYLSRLYSLGVGC